MVVCFFMYTFIINFPKMEIWRDNMGINAGVLKGYLLEEALAKLIQSSGYTLLTKREQSPDDLIERSNGLNVIGRGGFHQADVLGQFPYSYPFTYPTRLFVEAKFRRIKTGIDVVRKGIGIINDLNSNYLTAQISDNTELLVQRYNYNYAIFSTSGFSEDATKLAIAHKIHLIDLSGAEYNPLKQAISDAAERIIDTFDGEIPKHIVKDIRLNFRSILYFQQLVVLDEPVRIISNNSSNILFELAQYIQAYGDLYLASSNTPYIILLKPNKPTEFKKLFEQRQKIDASISWRRNQDGSTTWHIHLDDLINDGYLSFRIPDILSEYIFKDNDEQESLMRAIESKKKFLSNLTFFTIINDHDYFINIRYKTVGT